MLSLYTESDIMELNQEYVTNDSWYSITTNIDNQFFDGYAQVYEAEVEVHKKDGSPSEVYDAQITHEALSFYLYGE